MLTEPASPSSVLALLTTVHLGLAALRNHRSSGLAALSSLAFVSLALAALPWLFASPLGLALGVGVHLAWFVACEYLGVSPLQRASRGSSAPARAAASQGAQGSLASTTSAASPAVAARVASAAAAPPRGFVQTPILATFEESPDIKTVRMARPESFAFEAGQFVPVRLRVDGKEYVRCYSISSSPNSTGYLEISVKRQGLVSNALHATARPGAILSIKAPNGAFRYPARDDRPIVLLAAGVGITPLLSMLRHAVHAEPSRPVTLIYGARDERNLAFRSELLMLAARHPQVRIIFALSQQATPTGALHIYPGRIDAELLRTTVPDIAHSIALICGPAKMIADVKALLTAFAVPPSQIRHEVFEAAVAAAAGTKEEAAVSATVAAAGGGATARSTGGSRSSVAAGVQMRCLPSDVAVPVTAGQSLLEAAESAGVEIPSLCRAGVCGTCRVRVTDGSVDCESTTLDDSELGQGYVLACVSMARSNCTVQV